MAKKRTWKLYYVFEFIDEKYFIDFGRMGLFNEVKQLDLLTDLILTTIINIPADGVETRTKNRHSTKGRTENGTIRPNGATYHRC